MKQERKQKWQKLGTDLYELWYYLAYFAGMQSIRTVKRIYIAEHRFSVWVGKKLTPPLQRILKVVIWILFSIKNSFRRLTSAIGRGGRVIRRNVLEAAKLGPRFAISAFFATIFEGFKRNIRIFKTMLNYAAPVLGIAVLVITIQIFSSASMSLEVWHEGKLLGHIQQESIYNDAMIMFQQRIIYEEGEEPFQAKPEFKLCMARKGEIVGQEALVDRMVKMSAKDIVEANGIYIDNIFQGAVADATKIENAVEELLQKNSTGVKGEKVELVRPLRVVSGLYPAKSVVEEQKILDLMSSEVEGEILYTIQAGDTPSGVAKANGIAYSEFKAMNPDCETNFLIGATVYLAKSEPYMAVKVIRRETRKEITEYKTETTTDSKKSISYNKVVQNGVNGITEVTEDVEYVNGMEIGRTEVSSKVLQKVVNKKIVRGSKISGNIIAGGNSTIQGLKFAWPLNGGRLGDGYGWRWGRMHYGMDIIANRGTEIYAAEDGVVELSRWYSDFGRCVIINHGGGVKTLYAHASSLIAVEGTQVKKGQVIALVGSTGWSYGNHLHFEVRRNGSRINPRPYILS